MVDEVPSADRRGTPVIHLDCGRLDLDRAVVHRDGETVPLTRTECDLLAYLARTPGAVVSRETLLEQVWGYAPSSSSQAVHVAIRRLRKKIERDPSEPAHLKTVPGVGWLLDFGPPPSQSGLVGRDELLATLAERIEPGGVWTLLGPGGIGKTRLARTLIHRRGGTFIDLSTCTGEAEVVVEAARALDCPARVEAVRAALSRRSDLVVLDNVEQVVDVAPQTIGHWVGGAPLLLTSRVRANLVDEQVVPVPALDPESAAQLYARRARAAGSDRDLDPDAVRSLCVALEGNALCIELAASRARLMDPATLEARLSDRFSILRARRGDRPERHLALEAAIDWSWQLLDPQAQRALSALCCFRGGFTLEAAERVIGADGLDLVQELLDASLCFSETGRLDLWDSVRAFVLAHQPPDEHALDRHAAWCAELVHDPDPAVPATIELTAARAVEVPNLLAAARRDMQSGNPRLVELATGLGTLAGRVAIPEAEPLMRAALDQASRGTRARLLRQLGWLRLSAGATDEALALMAQSAQATDDPLQRGSTANAWSQALIRLGRYDEAAALLDEADRLIAEAEHPMQLASLWATRGTLEYRRSRLDKAEQACRRSIELYRQLGKRREEAIPLGNLAGVLLERGRPAEARRYLEEATQVFEQARDYKGAALNWCNLGRVLVDEGKLDDAEAAAARAIELEPSEGRIVAATRSLQGTIAAERGHLPEARAHMLAAIRAAERVAYTRSAAAYRIALARLMRQEDDRAGAAVQLDEAVAMLDEIGDVHHLIVALCERADPGDLERAQALLEAGAFDAKSDPAVAVRRALTASRTRT